MRYIILFVVGIFSGVSAYGQAYYKNISIDKVTITYPEYTVTADVRPVKQKVIPKKDMEYYWYRANTIIVTQGGYSGKLLNGLYSSFYPNKNLREQGSFKKGVKAGEWKSWWESGSLREVMTWKNGRESGKFFRYDEGGQKKEEGNYRKGKLNGKVVTYVGVDSIKTSFYAAGNVVRQKKSEGRFGLLKRLFEKPYRGKLNILTNQKLRSDSASMR